MQKTDEVSNIKRDVWINLFFEIIYYKIKESYHNTNWKWIENKRDWYKKKYWNISIVIIAKYWFKKYIYAGYKNLVIN